MAKTDFKPIYGVRLFSITSFRGHWRGHWRALFNHWQKPVSVTFLRSEIALWPQQFSGIECRPRRRHGFMSTIARVYPLPLEQGRARLSGVLAQ